MPASKNMKIALDMYHYETNTKIEHRMLISATRLRLQDGSLVLTIPSDIAERLGWVGGKEVCIRETGNSVNVTASTRTPKGRKSISLILDGIDGNEIQSFNSGVSDDLASEPVGKEVI